MHEEQRPMILGADGLPMGGSGQGIMNNEAALRVIGFVECLKHVRSPWTGKPFKLLPWQEKIIRDVFGTVRDEDPSMRQYNQVYIEIGKKNGKSELGAALALNMLINDDEWKAEVYSCASDRQQAAIVFDVAVDMVRQNPTLSKLIKIIQGIAVYGGRHLKGGCKMRTA